MVSNRAKSATRLQVEALESRALLAGTGTAESAGLLPTNPQGAGTLAGGGFPGQVSAIAAAATIGYPMQGPGFISTPGTAIVLVGVDPNTAPAPTDGAPLATTGLGQLTITTGANTPGIGSFACSTLGYASENGGRSGG
jgi:hypothetical protein